APPRPPPHNFPNPPPPKKMNVAVVRKDFRPQLQVRCCRENRGFRRAHEDRIRFVHQVRVYQNSNRAVHCCCAVCNDPESFLEKRGGEREKSSRCGRRRTLQNSVPRVLPLGARVISNPRTVAGLVQPFGESCRLGRSTTAMSGVICCLCQLGHVRKKRWRLTDKEAHVR